MGILKKKSCTNGALTLVFLGYGLLLWIRHSQVRPRLLGRKSRDAGALTNDPGFDDPAIKHDALDPVVLSQTQRNVSRIPPIAHKLGETCLHPQLTTSKFVCKYYAGPKKPQCCCLITSKSELRCLPSFVIIGAQKSGSTALLGYMLLHPAFGAPLKKELHFFDKAIGSERLSKSRSARSDVDIMFSALGKYLGRFPRTAVGSTHRFLTGEATPAYVLNRKAPALMKKLIPDAKLLLVLRDPVDRAYSEWQMKHRRVLAQLDPEDVADVALLQQLVGECVMGDEVEHGDAQRNAKDTLKFVKDCLVQRCKVQTSNKLKWLGFHARDLDIILSCIQSQSAGKIPTAVDDNILQQCVKNHRRESVRPFAEAVAMEMQFIRERCMAPAVDVLPAEIADLRNNDSWQHPHLMRFEWGKCFPSGSSSNIVKDFVVRGLYLEQIKDYHRVYHPDDLLILADQDLRTHTADTMQRVYDYVGLPQRADIRIPNSTELHDLIDKQYPYFETSSGWHLDSKYPPMDVNVRAELQEFFRPHNLRLAAYLQRDFHWGY
eukprot:m.382686 g.382686  ORF g.382686 m.382686 type:complete len:546 (+) comp20975_c0_seq3:164-1801(+)